MSKRKGELGLKVKVQEMLKSDAKEPMQEKWKANAGKSSECRKERGRDTFLPKVQARPKRRKVERGRLKGILGNRPNYNPNRGSRARRGKKRGDPRGFLLERPTFWILRLLRAEG